MKRRERCVLVTLTDVVGGSVREPGTHMAVSQTGASIGSFSGGCIEAAVVGEALAVLQQGTADLVRFGAGSRYIDIRLPCGGGIDLLFTPDPDAAVVDRVIDQLAARRPVSLRLDRAGSIALSWRRTTGWTGGAFTALHDPDLRLVIIGHGAETVALARLGRAHQAEIRVLSPDAGIRAEVMAMGLTGERLLTPRSAAALNADAHSAILFLFHDHDWETDLLVAALASPAFFIGAMGSRMTHARRCAALADRGIAPRDIARIAGPVGLIPASRDPETLALSILAQVVQRLGDRQWDAMDHDEILPLMNDAHQVMRM